MRIKYGTYAGSRGDIGCFFSVTPTGDGRVRIDGVGARCWLVRQDGKGMGTGQDGYNYVGTRKKKKPTNNTG